MRRLAAAGKEAPDTDGFGTSSGGSRASNDTCGVGVERFSGLRIAERRVRPQRWDELMQGKSYWSFEKLTNAADPGSNNVVFIGVVYEQSLQKTSANGNSYAHWSITDLAFPEPRVATLFLHGEAFDTWGAARDNADGAFLEASAKVGAIIALLNPVPLADRGSQDGSAKSTVQRKHGIKISHGSQLVPLGTCPSLGFCTCHKKDGLPCSMPCDRERGPLICFYHTMQREAQKIRNFQSKRSGSNFSSNIEHESKLSKADPSISVMPPAPSHITKSVPGSKGATPPASSLAAKNGLASKGAIPSDLFRSRTMTTMTTTKESRDADAATRRLLAAGKRQNSSTSCAAKAKTKSGARTSAVPHQLPASPMRRRGTDCGPGAAAKEHPANPFDQHNASKPSVDATSCTPGNPVMSRQEMGKAVTTALPGEVAVDAAVKKLLANGGIRAPDPNNPLDAALEDEMRTKLVSSRESSFRQQLADVSKSASQLARGNARSWAGQAPVHHAPQAGSNTMSIPSSGRAPKAPCSSKANAEKSKNAITNKLKAEYGSRIAMQLMAGDPKNDLIRKQTSRFASVVEQERIAKRNRHLSELEAQDEAAAKMEALMHITVSAWKCCECSITSESPQSRALCEGRGHRIIQVQAERTRWECRNCSWSLNVLDKQVPPHCHKCNGLSWRQVPLRRAARAPMEKEGLLPRGEELPFLNSVPGVPKAWKIVKEGRDDYAGLSSNPFDM